MKIGVLVKNLNNSGKWELDILKKFLKESQFETIILLKPELIEDRNSIDFLSFCKRVISYLGDFFLKLYTLEESILGENIDNSCTIESLLLESEGVEIEELSVKKARLGEIFSSADLEKIDSLDFDVILKIDYDCFNEVSWNLNNIPIWTLKYSGFFESDGKYAAIKEIISGDPNVSISLIRLDSKDPEETIDRSFCNLDFSLSSRKSYYLIIDNAISLLRKNIRLLDRGSNLGHPLENEYGTLPNLTDILKYLKKYNIKLFKRTLAKIDPFFGKEQNRWALFLGEGDFLKVNISDSIACKMPKDEFWADPFLFKYQEHYYVFFEIYSYLSKKGKISCGRIEKNEIIDVVDVFDFDYHLSYPFIFEEEGEIYMMPESFENKKVEVYRCLSFPKDWELYSSAFHGEEIVDSTYFVDKLNQKWLFLNKRPSVNSMFDSELHIYKIDSLKFNHIVPHNQNPVLIDARSARNAGAIFEYNGNYYRPSQRNTNGMYGEGLNINLIEKLTIDEYKEKIVRIFEPSFKKGFVGLHHIHQLDDLFVFDSAYRRH